MRSIAVILAVLILAGSSNLFYDQSEGAPSGIEENEPIIQIENKASSPAMRSSTSGNLTDHDPIIINNETELEDLMENKSWPGNGTEEDPYRIEDLDIDAEGEDHAIYFEDISSYLVISNCNLYNNSKNYYGNYNEELVYMKNSGNITILDCDFHETYRCIYFEEAWNISINSTSFFNTSDCVYNHYSTKITELIIKNCSFYNSTGDGINIDYCTGFYIFDSFFEIDDEAMEFTYCEDILINNTSFDGCRTSIRMYKIDNITISDSLFLNDDEDAIELDELQSLKISNCNFTRTNWDAINLDSGTDILINNIISIGRYDDGGISFNDISRCEICHFEIDGEDAIFNIRNSNDLILKDGSIISRDWNNPGIWIQHSFDSRLINISVFSEISQGVRIISSDDLIISKCILESVNSHGLYIENSKGLIFIENQIKTHEGNSYSFFSDQRSNSNSYYGNKITGSPIHFQVELEWYSISYKGLTDQILPPNNTLNGKPIRYFNGVDLAHGTVPDGSQYFFVNCSNLTLKGWSFRNETNTPIIGCKNVLLDSILVSESIIGDGLHIGECTNLTISNSNFTNNNDEGIWIHNSRDININNSSFFENDGFGLEIDNSMNILIIGCNIDYPGNIGYNENLELIKNTIVANNYLRVYQSKKVNIRNNSISSERDGFYIDRCRNFTLENNSIISDDYGILLYSSNDGSLSKNKISYTNRGIYVSYCDEVIITEHDSIDNCDYGIYDINSENLMISSNNITDCQTGIYLDGTERSTITYNIIKDCSGHALECSETTEKNLIQFNSFIENNGANGNEYDPGSAQIKDDSNNYYYSGGSGNHYSEHTSPDENFDGIVDEEYLFHGIGESDRYPLVRTPIPTFDAPKIMSIKPGPSSATLVWTEPAKRYGKDIQGYKIYIKEGKGPFQISRDISPAIMTKIGHLTDGQSYSFMVSAYNEMGEGLLSAPASTVPDGTGPEILIHTPVEGSSLNHEIVELQWSCIDVETSVEIIEISIDGGVFFEIAEGIGSYDMMDLPEGDHIVTIRSGNSIGLISEKSVNFTVDRTSPYLVFDDPGPLYSNIGSFPILWTAGDNISGLVEEFTILIEGRDPVITEYYEYDVEISEEGSLDVIISFSDRAGNIGDASITVVRDETPPEIIVTPESGSLLNNETIVLDWISDGTGSPVVKTEVSVDRGRSENMMEGPLELKDLRDGSHIISFYIVDKARNFASIDVTFTIDTTPPRIEYQVPYGDEVALDTYLEVVFSEDVVDVTVLINGRSYDTRISGNKVTINPVFEWEMERTYTVEIFAEDLAGNRLGNGTYQFSTVGQGTASGKLVDPDGRPVKDAIITFQGTDYRSDSEGRFVISGPTGEHMVLIKAKGYLDQNLTVTLVPGEDDELGNIVIIKKESDSGGLSAVAIISILLSVVLLIVIIVLIAVIIRRSKRGLEYEDMAMMKEIMSGFGVRRNPREINCYQILGIRRRASDWEIKKAYRNMASIYHPDRNNGRMDPDHDEKIREINAAKTILLDREKREVHDRMLNHFE